MQIHNINSIKKIISLQLPENKKNILDSDELFFIKNITDLNFLSYKDIKAAFKGGINNIFLNSNANTTNELNFDSDVFLYANLFSVNKLNNLMHLSKKVKAFVNDPNIFIDSNEYLNAFYYAKTFNMPVVIYARDYHISKDSDMNESYTSNLLGLRGDLEVSENISVYKYLSLAKISGVKIHFSSITSAKSIELIEQFKNDGVDVSCDVPLINLLAVDEDVREFDTNFKVQPPLRSEENQKKMIDQIKKGKIDAISSCHNPLILDDKLQPFQLAKAGVSIADIFLPLCLSFAEKNNISLEKMQHILSFGAKLFNISSDNFVVYRKKKHNVNSNWMSFGKNCPWFDDIIDYQVCLNFCSNKIVYIR